jgi:uncharacterized metal-binding protein YceD (DUF177 family)
MFRIPLAGLTDGTHSIQLSTPVTEIPFMAPEFIGVATFEGSLVRNGSRILLRGTAHGDAQLFCDRSLEDFIEPIDVEYQRTVVVDTARTAREDANDDDDESQPLVVREDDRYIDITDDIRQELMVHLPMRRIAPQYRDAELEDVFPQLQQREEDAPVDERWAQLQQLRRTTSSGDHHA